VAAIVAEEKPFAIGQDVCIISGNQLKGQFLFYLLNSALIKAQLIKLSAGSTFKRINLQDIRNYYVPLIEDKEQKEIASVLFSIDEVINKEENYKVILEQTKKSLMQVILTGRIRIKLH